MQRNSIELGLVSIIIPSFNYGKFISYTIESLLSQTYTKWEAIIIDDGSSDRTDDIMRGWLTKDVRLSYEKQIKQGPSAARNLGLKKASGEFIMFLDADDLISPMKLQRHIEHFAQNDKMDISVSKCWYFRDGYPNNRFTTRELNFKKWSIPINGGIEKSFPIFIHHNNMVIQAPLLRRRLTDKIPEGFDVEMKRLQDWDYWMKCVLQKAEFGFLESDDAYGLVRVHKSSLSENKAEASHYASLFYNKLHSFLEQNTANYSVQLAYFKSFEKNMHRRRIIKNWINLFGLSSVINRLKYIF